MTACNPGLEHHTQVLADLLPNGPLFEAKNIGGSNLRKVLRGFAHEFSRARDFLCTLESEYFPDKTNLFLNEWESAVGIPDCCFTGAGTNDERRRDILVKLTAAGVQTAKDFEYLASVFGVCVKIRTSCEIVGFPYTFPIIFFDNPSDARYVIFVDVEQAQSRGFPYPFPVIFGSPDITKLECIFNKVKPANCIVRFRSVPQC